MNNYLQRDIEKRNELAFKVLIVKHVAIMIKGPRLSVKKHIINKYARNGT